MARTRRKTQADLARHFERRLRERYGIAGVSAAEVGALVRAGRVRDSWKESNSRTHHVVDLAGHAVRIVYNTRLNMPVTALPPLPDAAHGR